MDVLHTERQQGQEYDDCLLLIPGNVVGDRELVDIGKPEDFLQLQGNQSKGVGVVALPCVENPGNTVDVTEIQLIILVLSAAGRQDDDVLWAKTCSWAKPPTMDPVSISVGAGHFFASSMISEKSLVSPYGASM